MRISQVLRTMAIGLMSMSATMGFALAETESSGSLCTTDGEGISGTRLRELVDEYIPTDDAHSSLFVLTQCYGGNMVDTLAGRDNTAVISATSEGEQAIYGGYDDDAAEGLRPEEGRDSDDVHEDGTAGKDASETPSQSGDPVSLEPVSEDGEIQSRHILVYAGIPSSLEGRDDDQRDEITDNFSGEDNTTVHTVGGDGTGGWDHPGTEEGLKDALEEIQELMNENEQFIMFVTDHGDQDVEDSSCFEFEPGFYESEPLILEEQVYFDMLESPDNIPGLTVFVPNEFQPQPCNVFFGPQGFFNVPFNDFVDLNRNGIMEPGDGWEAWIPLDENQMNPRGDVAFLENLPPQAQVGVTLSSGAVAKGEPDPTQCSGLERVRKAKCVMRYRDDCSIRKNKSVVKLTGGVPGDTYTITILDSGDTASGVIDDRGKGKARFRNMQPGEYTVVVNWGCGATEVVTMICEDCG